MVDKFKGIVAEIKETFSASTIHSFPNIVSNKSYFLKLMWFMFFMASSAACTWFIHGLIINYLQYDVTSLIEINYVNQVIFPVINICSLNPYSTPSANKLFTTLLNDSKPNMMYIYLANILSNYYGQGNNKLFDRKFFGATLEDIIVECTFDKKECNLDEDFTYFYDTNYGNCFRFNSGLNKNGSQVPFKYVKQNGVLNALQMTLYIEPTSQNNNIFSFRNGFNIFINNESLDSTAHEGFMLSPGFSTNIILNKYSLNQKPKPYSSCIDNLNSIDAYPSDCYRKTFSPNKTYHYIDCLNVCFQKHVAINCNCQSTIYDLVYDNTLRKCSINLTNLTHIFEDGNCQERTYYKLYNSSENIQNCDCPIECYKTDYIYKTSFSEFPTQNYIKYLKDEPLINRKFQNTSIEANYESLSQSLVQFNMFYDELKETTLTHEVKIQLTDLVAGIGGTLGLFLGISFLSLVEFVEIFFKILVILFKRSDKVELFNRKIKVKNYAK